jgi:hypothetical protein
MSYTVDNASKVDLREREREIYKKTRVAIFKRIQRTKKNEPSSFALSAAFSARNLSNSLADILFLGGELIYQDLNLNCFLLT